MLVYFHFRFASVPTMEHLRMKLASYNSNSDSIFLRKVSQTGIGPARIRPFLIIKFNFLPLTLVGK